MLDRIEAHLNRGEWQQAKRLAGAVLAGAEFSDEEKARAGVLGARAGLMSGEPFVAVKMAERALGSAQLACDDEWEGRASFHLGAAYLHVGDNAQARVYLNLFLDGLQSRWSCLADELGARAYGNLAQVLRNQQLYGDSLRAYGQALKLFAHAGDVRGQIAVFHQTAWVLMLLGDYDEAGHNLDMALGFGEIPEDLQPHHISHEALLCLYRGQLHDALSKAQELLSPGRPHVKPSSKAVALFVGADVNRRLGQNREALLLAELAREAAMESQMASLMNMVAALLRQLKTTYPTTGA